MKSCKNGNLDGLKDKPFWMRKPGNVTNEEDVSCYISLSNDREAHFSVKHFSVESLLGIRALLYVPRRAPLDMFESTRKSTNLTLLVRRVLILDDYDELLPEWLLFVFGFTWFSFVLICRV